MSIFKIFLMLGLMMYTFVTMVGGNPDRDPYGFRYWRDPVRRSCGPIYCWILIQMRLITNVPTRALLLNTSSRATPAVSLVYSPA
jgi:amino acid permease